MFCFRTPGCPEQKHPGVASPYTRMLKVQDGDVCEHFRLFSVLFLLVLKKKHLKGIKVLRCRCM